MIREKTLKGQTNVVKSKAALLSKLSEASYSMMGGRSHATADSSFADRDHIATHVAAMQQAIGSKWQYVARTDDDGVVDTQPYFDPDVGDMVYPDDKGRVRTVNQQYLDKMLEIENYIENKVDIMMSYCVASKDLCKDVLNLGEKEYFEILGPDASGRQVSEGMSREMAELDATIDSIKASPAASITQTAKISKLRWVCRQLRQRFAIRNMYRHVNEDVNRAGPEIDVVAAKTQIIASNFNNPKMPKPAAAATDP